MPVPNFIEKRCAHLSILTRHLCFSARLLSARRLVMLKLRILARRPGGQTPPWDPGPPPATRPRCRLRRAKKPFDQPDKLRANAVLSVGRMPSLPPARHSTGATFATRARPAEPVPAPLTKPARYPPQEARSRHRWSKFADARCRLGGASRWRFWRTHRGNSCHALS